MFNANKKDVDDCLVSLSTHLGLITNSYRNQSIGLHHKLFEWFLRE